MCGMRGGRVRKGEEGQNSLPVAVKATNPFTFNIQLGKLLLPTTEMLLRFLLHEKLDLVISK